MRLLCFLVWKNWASSPLRLLLTLLGVALGVAIVASIHVLDHNTILSQLERQRWDYGRPDFELRSLDPKKTLEQQREELRRHPGIERVGLLGNTFVLASATGHAPKLVSLWGQSPIGGSMFGHYRVARGRDLSDLDPEASVLVSEQLAKTLALDVGSKFDLGQLPGQLHSRCVNGEWVKEGDGEELARLHTEAVVRGILEPIRLARQSSGIVVIGRFSFAQRLARVMAPLFQVKRTPGTDPDKLETELRQRFVIEDSRSALIGEDADERAFRNGVKVLGCLALVLGMFVIFHTLSHALAEKIRQVGILRCLGATVGQVSSVFLLDALALSVLGTALGLAGGVWLAHFLAQQKITTLGLGKTVTTFEIPWSQLLAIAALGVIMTMLGAAFPLFKVRRLSPQRILYARDLAPPADLMRGVNVFLLVLLVVVLPLGYLIMTPLLAGEGRGAGLVLLEAVAIVGLFFAVLLLSPRVVRLLGGLPLRLLRPKFPLAGFLVQKNLLRSPARLATSVCGLTLVALAMLGMRTLTGSLKGEIRNFGAVALDHRLFLKTTNATKEETWRGLRNIPGVRSVLPLSAVVTMPFHCVGTDVDELQRPGGALADRPAIADVMKRARGLVISSRLARLRDIAPGEQIRLKTGAGPVSYHVVAVSDKEGFFPDERAYAVAAREWLHNDFCLDVSAASRFSLRLDPGTSPEAVATLASRVLGPLDWHRSGAEVLAFHLADVDRDFRFFDILLYLLLVLAGVGQVNLITLATIARAREIGVLRALGMTRGDFFGVLLIEATVVGFLTGVLALAAGLPLSWVLVAGLELVSGLHVPYVLPWLPALGIAALGFGVALLSALPPALRATRVAPAASVRTAE